MTTLFDDLQDLEDFNTQALSPESAEFRPTYTEVCKKCNGSGKFISWAGRVVGPCRACGGIGSLTRKTSPEQRARAKANAVTRKASNMAANWADFAEQHPEVARWIIESPDFEFAKSLGEAVQKFGTLTERQLAAAQSCVAKRNAARQAQASRINNAPVVDVSPLVESFARATSNGLKKPKLRLPGYTFSLAPATGKNAGAIYVKADDTYMGKLMGGKFFASRDCNADQTNEVVALCADPANAAIAYGRRTGRCAICGAELTNHDSIERGIGPICAGRFGF